MANLPKTAFWMARGLEQSLTQGLESWAEDTPDRAKWLSEDNEAWHVIAGTMLVGCFAYAEGKQGKNWWQDMRSEAAKRDLDILWIARNAYVHKDGNPAELWSTSEADIDRIRQYCVDLESGNIFDDKGNKYPIYMQFTDENIILNKCTISIIARLFETAYRAFS